MSEIEKTETTTSEETFAFQAEINQLMSLIINTFYSNKEVFLRELISNSSDALDKIRYESLQNVDKLDTEKELKINIKLDKENSILSLEDTGIGMTRNDLINNLGTIAKSGTKGFMEQLENGGDLSMIGQFGVGFYSAYLVADSVKVITKHNDDEEYSWESNAGGSFIIKKSNTGIKRGTRLELTLKDDQNHLLEESKIKELIKKHSEFISYPLSLLVTKTRTVEVEEEEEEEEVDAEGEDEKVDEDGVKVEVEEDETKEKKKKTKEESYTEWELVNIEKPIWCKNPEEVEENEYNSFYKHISGDYDDCKKVKHFSVEGQLEFKGLLFIPKRAPMDSFEPNKKKNNLKLYVRKIFITDDSEDLCPDWMTFIKGVIDSEDLPLNISRETLQKNQIMKVIKKNIIKKCIEALTDLSKEDNYDEWYNEFSKNIKLGIHEDSTNKDKLAKLLKYVSSKSNGKLVSLMDYVKNMKENQKSIYYVSGESIKSVEECIFLEKLKKRDLEVLLMCDPIDEYCMQQLKEFEGKTFVNISKENLDLELSEEEKAEEEENKKKYEELCKTIKSVLNNHVENVVVSNRLSDAPCCLVTSEYGWTANMERIMKAQALRNDNMMHHMMGKRILEINVESDIIQELFRRLNTDKNDKTIKDITWLLYETTLLNSGFSLEESGTFCNRIYKMLRLGLDLNSDVVEEEEEVEEEVVEEEKKSENDVEESSMEELD